MAANAAVHAFDQSAFVLNYEYTRPFAVPTRLMSHRWHLTYRVVLFNRCQSTQREKMYSACRLIEAKRISCRYLALCIDSLREHLQASNATEADNWQSTLHCCAGIEYARSRSHEVALSVLQNEMDKIEGRIESVHLYDKRICKQCTSASENAFNDNQHSNCRRSSTTSRMAARVGSTSCDIVHAQMLLCSHSWTGGAQLQG